MLSDFQHVYNVNAPTVCCVDSETPPPFACWLHGPFDTPPPFQIVFHGLKVTEKKLVFAEEARLVLISRGVWDPRNDPRGKKPSHFHTALHRD